MKQNNKNNFNDPQAASPLSAQPNQTNDAPLVESTGKPTKEDPDNILAIIALVLMFVFWPLGLVLALIAYNQSKNKGYKNTIANIALLIPLVYIVLIIFAIIMIVLAITL